MAAFEFLALDPSGRERLGRLLADNEGEARASLERKDWMLLRLGPATTEVAPRRTRERRLGLGELAMLTRQLATLLSVTPLEEALRTLAWQSPKLRVRELLQLVHGRLVEGHRFSEALGECPAAFPPIYRAMVAAGESTGALPALLERLADMLEAQQQVRSRLLAALVYPAVLSVAAIGVVAALMAFVVPKVVDQFDSMGRTLPLLTRIVIAVSDWVAQWGVPALVALVLAMAVASLALRRESVRFQFDSWVLAIPLLGRLVRDVHAAIMARTLATVVASGLPLVEGLDITARTIRNRAVRRATEEMVVAIQGGSSLSAAMHRAGVFPPTLLYLASSGEESGRLAPLLERAADYLDREFRTFTLVAMGLLEPAIIVILGGVVAVIVLAILLPIMQFNSFLAT